MLGHLPPNATLSFKTKPVLSMTGRNKRSSHAIEIEEVDDEQEFSCSAYLNTISISDIKKIPLSSSFEDSGGACFSVFLWLKRSEKFPKWITKEIPVTVRMNDSGAISNGRTYFRRTRSDFAKQHKLGVDFFIQEIKSR